MKSTKTLPALFSCAVLLAAAVFSTPAKADQWDKKTIMTVSEEVQVPNKVLEPGTYVFKLLNSDSDRHVVQIFNQDETHIVTTVIAIPNYRLQPTGKTEFAFWETPAGQPRAMRAWFYPGDNFGQEFAYPKTVSSQIAENNGNASVPVESAPVASTTTPEPQTAAPAPAPEPAAQPAPEPTPEPQTTAAVSPEPAQSPAVAQNEPVEPSVTASQVTELPHTASYYPAIMLAGLVSLLAYAIMAVRVKRTS